jgi:hypothetical protein
VWLKMAQNSINVAQNELKKNDQCSSNRTNSIPMVLGFRVIGFNRHGWVLFEEPQVMVLIIRNNNNRKNTHDMGTMGPLPIFFFSV